MVTNTVNILDNGAYTIKIGSNLSNEPKIIPNCIMKAKSERRRPFVGDQIEECRDASGLFYILCFQKGYLTNWEVQKTVWDYVFSADCASVSFSNPLIITEPQFNFTSIQDAMTEIFFEEYECETLLRTTAADLCAHNFLSSKSPNPLCCIVIDMGYSFVHIIPFIKGKKVKAAIRRIDIGGKILTNHLKEIISYRQLNVMDESYVINQVKEDSCFVSQNFYQDMENGRKKLSENTIAMDYVLPDFTSIRRGFLQEPSKNENRDMQTLRLTNERFVIPELLFHPSDVGIKQKGVPEALLEAIEECPPETMPHLFVNIIVVGGCACFPGMETRLQAEIRQLAPDDMDVNVVVAKNPLTYAWEGGIKLSESSEFLGMCLNREEYEEEGIRGAYDRFDI